MRGGVVHLAARTVTTEDLLLKLQFWLGVDSRLEDKTGLTEKYDLKLEFAEQLPRGSAAEVANGGPTDAISDPAPDLFVALEKQLGLKLEKIRVPVDVVVIDRLNQQPTDN